MILELVNWIKVIQIWLLLINLKSCDLVNLWDHQEAKKSLVFISNVIKDGNIYTLQYEVAALMCSHLCFKVQNESVGIQERQTWRFLNQDKIY